MKETNSPETRRLRESERLYRALFQSHPHPMWVHDSGTLRFLAVNDAAVAHYGYSRPEFLAMTVADLGPAGDTADGATARRHRRRDGSLIDVELTSHPIHYLGTPAEMVAAHDVTARRQAEHALARRNRLYAMLSQTNERLLRATDRQALLDGVCRVAVEQGGFLFAWLGLLDDARGVRVVARAGQDQGYVDALRLRLDGPPDHTRGPTLRALRNGEHVVSNDFLADPATWLRHDAAARVGVRASAAFPLRVNGAVVGALSLYADEVGFFGSDELETLDEMAADVAFGLEVFERNELLRASEQTLRQVMDTLHVGVWLLDAGGRIVAANVAGQRIWAGARYVNVDEFGQYRAWWSDTGRPISPHEWAGARAIEKGEISIDEVVDIECFDGSRKTILNTAVPLVDDQGGIRGAIVVNHDITERRAAEIELRKLSQAVEQAAESLVITDAIGRIEYVNRTFTLVSGYAREELIGRNPRVLQSGRTPPATYEQMWATLSGGHPWSGEFINRRKDGTEYTESVTISPVRQADGTITHYVAVKEDITERRRNEQELERYRRELEALVQQRTAQLGEALAQAEAANEAKSAFLANMSHEIRTPMNGVLGMLEILERSCLTGQQADLVRVARDSGRTLLGIIDDILDLSKIEAGRIQIVPEEVALTDVVEGLCDSLLPVAARKGVELAVFVDPALPERVLTDPLRLRQILFNVLGNAIKFSGGRAQLAGQVRVRVTRGDGAGAGATHLPLAITVADNGIGMTAEETARLFQPFTQAEATTTRRFGGTGLGLTICRRLVGLMGGRIDVASARGAGTTFTLTIPVDVAPLQPARPHPDLAGLDCVLIDAADLDGDALDAYLRAAGARVERRVAAEAGTNRRSAPGSQLEIRYLGHAAVSQEQIMRWPGPCLLITCGRRRRLRPEAPGVVTLDSAALRRDEFLRAVAVAAGRLAANPRPAVATAAASTPRALPVHEARARGELILIADDDEVNRHVIGRQLELLGRTAEVAHDGAEALRRWREGGYALVLTDLHMPGLDGYALTRAIRAEEARSRVAPTPIVALTANAMRGEGEQARAIGMNDYLVKPVQLDQLQTAIDRWMPVRPGAAPASPMFDPDVLRSYVGDHPQAVRELLQVFRETSLADGQAFHDACAAGDAEAAGQVAHKLKSSARSIGASTLGGLCEEVERAGRRGDLGAVLAQADAFDAAVRDTAAAVHAWLATEPH